MISIFVTIRIKDGFADQFREASFGDAHGATREEPGCFRFDILQNAEDSNLFHLYE
ncbi:MAG TPA: antibiotic biosynthesis monooxygenase, partial [Dehalococcoidia bacterium]|nr:antibiotic biosynthesis monooxygenase [Dehalococcoidia bacterium]